MPSEGHFGIRYDMDFLSPHFPLFHLLPFFFPVQIVFLYSRMGLLPLAVFNTALACFLIIFSSLHWHWFMRGMLDTPPRPAPTSLLLHAQFLSHSFYTSYFLYNFSDIFFLFLSGRPFVSLSLCLTISMSLPSLILPCDYLGWLMSYLHGNSLAFMVALK